MKNTIITSVSALAFLVIGLFIGKSNKQIEIQTVVKTNIVEIPVEKIVENIVEKPSNITDILTGIEYESLAINEFPANIKSITISVIVDNKIKKLIIKDELETKIELELRRVGLKIEKNAEKSDAEVKYFLNAVDLKNGLYVATLKLEIWRYVVFTIKDKNYMKPAAIWSNVYIGFEDANDFNKDTHAALSKQMDKLSNSILNSK
jgi:hypothetical protein